MKPPTPRAESIEDLLQKDSGDEAPTPEQRPMGSSCTSPLTPVSSSSQGTPDRRPADSSSTSPLTPILGSPVPEFKLDPEPKAEPVRAGANINVFNQFRFPKKLKQKSGLLSSSSSGGSSSSLSYAFTSQTLPLLDVHLTGAMVPYVPNGTTALVPFAPGGTALVPCARPVRGSANGSRGCFMREQTALVYTEHGISDQLVTYHLPADHNENDVGRYNTMGTK